MWYYYSIAALGHFIFSYSSLSAVVTAPSLAACPEGIADDAGGGIDVDDGCERPNSCMRCCVFTPSISRAVCAVGALVSVSTAFESAEEIGDTMPGGGGGSTSWCALPVSVVKMAEEGC